MLHTYIHTYTHTSIQSCIHDYIRRHFVSDAERNDWYDGATALVLALSDEVICVANVGDTRAVLAVVRSGQVIYAYFYACVRACLCLWVCVCLYMHTCMHIPT